MTELAILLAALMAPAIGFWLYVEHRARIESAYQEHAWLAAGVIVLIAAGIIAVVKIPALAIG